MIPMNCVLDESSENPCANCWWHNKQRRVDGKLVDSDCGLGMNAADTIASRAKVPVTE